MRVTVFGAISPCLKNARAFKLAKSTNSDDFCSFLVQIKQAILPRYRNQRQIVCVDGARAHTSKKSSDFIRGMFIPLQIPVMSCEFNCTYSHSSSLLSFLSYNSRCLGIEKYWHSTKTYFNKRLMAAQEDIDVERFHQLVNDSLSQVSDQTVLRICQSNRKFIANYLK